MKHAWIVSLALFVGSAFGQIIVEPGRPTLPFAELTKFLELSTQQVTQLLTVNAEWNRYLVEKQSRVMTVNREIDEEIHKAVLDAVGIGNRYVEIEAICREATDRQPQYSARARAVLNPSQTQRLGVLEQAFALAPVIWDAQNANLMKRTVKTPIPITSLEGGPQQLGLLPATDPLLPGCRPEMFYSRVPMPLDPTNPIGRP